MKSYLLVIGAIIIAVIIGLVVVFLVFFNQSQPTQTSTSNPFADITSSSSNSSTPPSITDFTANCFKVYIESYVVNQQSGGSSRLDQNAQACFTPMFISQWPQIIADSDSDPVLLSQDYNDSWLTNINVSISSQTQTTTNVIVNLGTGAETKQLLAQLQLTQSGWRISSVTAP